MTSTQESSSNEIAYSELKEQLNKSVLLIDVRDQKEIDKDGKIPSSINIPLATVRDALQKSDVDFESSFKVKKPGPGDKIIFHCHAGKRAAMGNQIATELGFANALTYKGSFSDWVSQGGTVERK